MKKEVPLILLLVFSSAALNAGNSYTGFWKGNCSEAFGLQIMPAENNKYSVSFCGPGGCFEPGTYRPNTTIKNDNLYQVISDSHIKVKTSKGWSDFYKCDANANPTLRYKE